MTANGGVEIRKVSKPSEMKAFLNFPYKHYKNDANYVPPLYIQQRDLLNQKKNPFFRNADAAYFLAYKNGKVCGRIAAIVDFNWVEFQGSKTGFWGFFESVDEQDVATKLIESASYWLKEHEMEKMHGPINPGMMYELGLLVEGHDKPSFIMMPWSKPYYDGLVKNAGLKKIIDLLAYMVTKETVALDRIEKADRIVRHRIPNIRIRKVDIKNFETEAETIRQIFNSAWAENWGFNPVPKEEFDHIAKDLKLILDDDIAYIAEIDGRPVGFTVGLPDMNQVFINNRNGRLFPFGIFKILLNKRKINRYRTALMGVIPEYRNKGIEALLNRAAILRGLEKGYVESELSWLLENNIDMIRVAEKIGGFLDKRYRIYGKEL